MTTSEAPTTALGAGSGFVVQLDAFSGPLDLLLHLLREEQLEIAEIPIARIADQFLQAIHELGLNQAADYLDMASRLVRFKRTKRIHVLKAHLNTEPKVYYGNLDGEVR